MSPTVRGGVLTQVEASQQNLPEAGEVFERKYRIVDRIGAGGFARVYRAKFEDVGRDVAIKILVPQFSPPNLYPEELVQRFHREARAVADLKSPHTVTLHDFGRSGGGLLYMVFEFVDGMPLDALVREEGALGPDRTVTILEQVVHSLREAHVVGILHRDIKPANIMLFDYLDETDKVKVLDFGIAKHWTHEVDGSPLLPDLTEDGTVIGTPRYMSPEQIVGQRLTPATDIYSLGLVAYEMLTGELAVPENVKSDVVRRHLGPEPFVLPTAVGVASPLAAIVHKMLEKDFRKRYQAVDELARDLRQWRDTGTSNADAERTTAFSRPDTPGSEAQNPGGSSQPSQQRNPTPFYNPAIEPDSSQGGAPTPIGAGDPTMQTDLRPFGADSGNAEQPTQQPSGMQPRPTQQPSGMQPRPTQQPSGVQPTQQPSGMQPRPTQQPSGMQPTQQPSGVQPTQQPSGVQPRSSQSSSGMHPHPSPQNAPINAATSQAAVPKPSRTVIQIHQNPGRFEVDVPMRPTKRAMIITGVTGLFFALAIVAPFGGFFFVLLTAAAFAWGASMALRSYQVVIQPDVGYEWTMDVFGLERQKRGPFGAVVRFEARGTDAEDNTVLKFVTHDGEFTVASAFREEENEWVAAEGNAWLQARRNEQSGRQEAGASGAFQPPS